MTSLEAALQVLREAEEPLNSQEITKRILEKGLWQTKGKTPAATVNARIAVEIKQRGSFARFRRVSPNVYTINPSQT